VVVRSETAQVADPSYQAFVTQLAADIAASAKVSPVVTTYLAQDPSLVSADGHATLLTFRLLAKLPTADEVGDVVSTVQAADRSPGFAVQITGSATLGRDFTLTSQRDLERGELYFGLPAALLVLLLVFGAVVAAGLPLLMALVCIPISLGIAALVGQVWNLSFFIQNMTFAMGLALGIDYSLFVVSRYREERRSGIEKLDAIARAGGTASVAVTFSGLSFTVALTGLLLVPDTVLRSLAVGAMTVGIVTVAASLTLLPAVLSLFGDRIDALRLPWSRRAATQEHGSESQRWLAFVHLVMRHAGLVLAATVGILLLTALPVLSLHTGEQGVLSLPDRLVAKQGYVAVQRDFPQSGRTDPARVVIPGAVDSTQVSGAVATLRSRLATDATFASTRVTQYGGTLTVVDVALPGNPEGGDAAKAAVRRLRAEYVHPVFEAAGVPAYVTGRTAVTVDYADLIGTWLPRVIAFVLALTFVLLTIVFRSLVLSVKAVLLNLLSVGAAYGLLVLVFQKGFGAGLLGLTKVETVEPWVPVFLFSVLFALSMDYHVFLLSRIRERQLATGDTRDAVAHGIASTGKLITGAALIIVVVFAGFATGDFVGFQQMGFGVAVALLLDATVIRSIVVPTAMVKLGSWNWYLPSWLQWLPELQVEPVTLGSPAGPPDVVPPHWTQAHGRLGRRP
jgi:RND superfamily putative drug exporter